MIKAGDKYVREADCGGFKRVDRGTVLMTTGAASAIKSDYSGLTQVVKTKDLKHDTTPDK